ncbi:peptidoglycan DD-metalloendopeptidase family protein [Streptomyces carminius]|uniref:peptidoglycan DD-metalloendopeptidase family protein n=1 Tax=Streptomyces carminius TaxID=2665496 RepID=UPI002FCE5BF5
MVNDRHPSGVSTPADPAADSSYGPHGSPYETCETYGQSPYGDHGQQNVSYGYATDTFGTPVSAYGDSDPLFGPLPGDTPAAPAASVPGHGGSWHTPTGHDGHANHADHSGTASWASVPAQTAASPELSGHSWPDTGYGTGSYAGESYGAPGTPADGTWDTGTGQYPGYDGPADHFATGWDDPAAHRAPEYAEQPGEHAGHPAPQEHGHDYGHDYGHEHGYDYGQTGYDRPGYDSPDPAGAAGFPGGTDGAEAEPGTPDGHEDTTADTTGDGDETADDTADDTGDGPAGPRRSGRAERPGPPAPRAPGSRRRRSARPKRSALLTVAVPSACVMGVTAVAAASVSDVGETDDTTAQAAADTTSVKSTAANRKLDTQLASLSDEAENFAGRASRTQERIDLKQRQELERKRKAKEAARKEAMRPKFALPVAQHGLSAYYGQAGLNWMSVHTGIDFPVSYGTPVRAATDGTVRTQFDGSYGNMVIVTAPDGTETWYCHLSSTRIRSGSVKAGDVIAYSGNSGNSTGPHLHFEVRPGGGSAIDPLAWLRSKGLDPT